MTWEVLYLVASSDLMLLNSCQLGIQDILVLMSAKFYKSYNFVKSVLYEDVFKN